MSRGQGLRTTLGAAFVALAWLYLPVLSGQAVFFDRDIILYWRPHMEWAARTLSQGHLPIWIPGSGFGMPFLADPSFQSFYPPTWLNVVLPPSLFYPTYVLGHALFGAWGAYRLLALTTRRPEAAVLGSLVFALAGPWVSAANLWHHYGGVAFIPWVLLGLERVRLRVPGAWRMLGIAAAGQALAGSADLCLASAGLAAFRLLTAKRPRHRRIWPDLGRSVALAAAIAAIQWLPTASILSESKRARHDLTTILYWSVPPSSLADMFVPGLLSEQIQAEEWRAQHMDGRSPFLASLYLGATVLPLAVVGLRAFPAAGWALGFLLLGSLGRYSFVAPLLALAPPFSWFRYPAKLFWPIAFVFAVLVCAGFASIRRRLRVARPFWLIALVFLGAALVVRRPEGVATTPVLMVARLSILCAATIVLSRDARRRSWVLLLLVVAADLSTVGRWGNNLAPAVLNNYRPPHVDAIRKAVGGQRIHVSLTSRPGDDLPDRTAFDSPVAEALIVLDRLLPPQLLRWGLLGSIDPDFTGLVTTEYSRLLDRIRKAPAVIPDLLWVSGVKFGLRFGAYEPTPEAQTIETFDTVASGKVRLAVMPWPQGRVRRISNLIHAPRSEDALEMILAPGFNPELSVVTADSPSATFPAGGSAAIVAETPSEVVVATDGPGPAWVVLNDEVRKGWTVSVDGREAPSLRMNYLFRGVAVGPGQHQIVFGYVPPGLGLGAATASAALLYLALIWARSRVSA